MFGAKIGAKSCGRISMPQLTEVKLRSIKPSGTIERFHDGKGLYLETSKAGGKYWRWKYRFEGKEKRLSLGPWPDVSLKDAREQCDTFRKLLRKGINPARKRQEHTPNIPDLRTVAEAWQQSRINIWSPSYAAKNLEILERDVFPYFLNTHISQIRPQDMLDLIRKIEARKSLSVATRVLGICSSIFRYGIAIGVVDSDPCRDLRGALTRHPTRHLAAVTKQKDAAELLKAIAAYNGSAVVRAAMLFSALTFCRPSEVRLAEWKKIDFDDRMWTTKTKTLTEHKVPLSNQTIEILKEIYPLTGHKRYVFASPRKKDAPLSVQITNSALRRMGFTKEQMTAHGFRSMASTMLNEAGQKFDVIEIQLGHKGHDRIRAIYNRAEYMKERRDLMQKWADYLDQLRQIS